MIKLRKILLNTAFLAGTNGLNLAVSFLFARLTSSYLGGEWFGNMVFVFSLTTFYETIVRASISMVLTQRTARKAENAQAYFWPALLMNLGFGVFFILGSTLGGWMLGAKPIVILAALVASLVSTTRILAESAISIQRGMDRMGPEFWTTLLERILYMASVIAILHVYGHPSERLTVGFLGIFAANVVTQGFQAFVLLVPLWRRLKPPFHLDREKLLDLYAASSPIWISGLLMALHYRLEVFLLARLSTGDALGAFGAAYKLMDAARLLPWMMCMAIFPALSRGAETASEQFHLAYSFTLKLLLLISLPFAVAFYLLAPSIMAVVFPRPEFAAAIAPLQWMSASLIPIFLNVLFGYGAIVKEQQGLMARAYGSGLLAHLVFALILVPWMGAVGGGISYLLGETALLIFCLHATNRGVSPLTPRTFARPAIFALLVAAVVGGLSLHSTALAATGGLMVYIAGLVGLGIFTSSERMWMRSLTRRG